MVAQHFSNDEISSDLPYKPSSFPKAQQYASDTQQYPTSLQQYKNDIQQYPTSLQQYKNATQQYPNDTQQYRSATQQYANDTKQYRSDTQQYPNDTERNTNSLLTSKPSISVRMFFASLFFLPLMVFFTNYETASSYQQEASISHPI